MSLHQRVSALGIAVLIGCGSQPPRTEPHSPPATPRPDPIPRTGGPTCKAVAERMAVVTGEHAPDQPDGDEHERAMLELRCETDHWSDDARSCLATVTTDAEADGCLHQLTQAQQQALAADQSRLRTERDHPAP